MSRSEGRPQPVRRFEVNAIAAAVGSAACAIGISLTGILQVPEWALLDFYFRVRPAESPDPRVVVLTIDDKDISQLGTWPLSDQALATTLTKLQAQKPRAIGLDLYRDLPVEPGNQELVKVFQASSNLIGAEKRFGSRQVPPPPTLKAEGRIAIVDLVEDADGRVRRNLISAQSEDGTVHLNLATRLALTYLEVEGIHLELLPQASGQYRLGKAKFSAFQGNDGGYVRADTNGYQTLLNFRGPPHRFLSVSLSNFLSGKVPKNWARDRVVLIGSIAESTNDFLLTPYDGASTEPFSRTPGVFVHANAVSQMVSAAIDDRPLIRVLPDGIEWLWVLGWSALGVVITCKTLQISWDGKSFFYTQSVMGAILLSTAVGGVGYGLFLGGWWIPCVPALLALLGSIGVCMLFHEQDLRQLAFIDGLTQVANRRAFEQQLDKQIHRKSSLSLILCDVDFFKSYNDTYGHQAGDRCLVKIAQALRQATRPSDMVARYGGEEFVIILPKATAATADWVAERILKQVRGLEIPHAGSRICDHVTLSCGVASIESDQSQAFVAEHLSRYLIEQADQALYQSKSEGRDRFTTRSLEFKSE